MWTSRTSRHSLIVSPNDADPVMTDDGLRIVWLACSRPAAANVQTEPAVNLEPYVISLVS